MKSVLHFLLLSIVSCEMGHNFVKGPFVNVLIAGYIGEVIIGREIRNLICYVTLFIFALWHLGDENT